MREEPPLEMLWLQNTETMDKVQRIDHSKKLPASYRIQISLLHSQYPATATFPEPNESSPSLLNLFA
jgi:hypothetical protein